MAFLCLNNGAFAGLLVLAAWLGNYHHYGGVLGTVGGAFLGACALTRFMLPEERDIIGAYLAQPNVVAVGGSWLAPAADLRAGNWDGITARARRVMASIAPAG